MGQLQTVAWTVNTLPRHHLHMQRWCAHSHAHAQQRYLLSSPEKKSYSAEPQVPSELASVQTEAPAAEYVPAGQLLQVEAPEAEPTEPNTDTSHSESTCPGGIMKYTYRPCTGDVQFMPCSPPVGRCGWLVTHAEFFSRSAGSLSPTKIEYPWVLSAQQSVRPAIFSAVTRTDCCMSTRHHSFTEGE